MVRLRMKNKNKSAFSFSITALFNGVATTVHYAQVALLTKQRQPYIDFLEQRYGIAQVDTQPLSRTELDDAFKDTHAITKQSGAIYALSAACLAAGGVILLGALPFAPAFAAVFALAAGGLATHATARAQTIAGHARWSMNFEKASRSVDKMEEQERQEQRATEQRAEQRTEQRAGQKIAKTPNNHRDFR